MNWGYYLLWVLALVELLWAIPLKKLEAGKDIELSGFEETPEERRAIEALIKAVIEKLESLNEEVRLSMFEDILQGKSGSNELWERLKKEQALKNMKTEAKTILLPRFKSIIPATCRGGDCKSNNQPMLLISWVDARPLLSVNDVINLKEKEFRMKGCRIVSELIWDCGIEPVKNGDNE